jgi:hypothetical protein
MFITFMAQENVQYLQIQYNTTNLYEKKSDVLVWIFFHNVFWLQCPSTASSITRRPVPVKRNSDNHGSTVPAFSHTKME